MLKNRIYSPCDGNCVELKDVKDQAFASGEMGKGLGFICNNGEVYAPLNGKVKMVFNTKHAVGIEGEDGVEVLLHIGIDTVNLKGEGFEVLVKENDDVKCGELIVKFDKKAIEDKGYDTSTMMIITNSSDFNIDICKAKAVKHGDEVISYELLKQEKAIDTSKYENGRLCSEILEAIGGKGNIKNVFHCITRLRIVPENRNMVDMEKLKSIKGIMKIVEANGQIQCVIGTTVPEVFNEFVEISGFDPNKATSSNAASSEKKEKVNPITMMLNTLASCVTPGLYAIVAGGMIKGVIALITAIGLVSSSSDIIKVLSAVGDAPFYFMPFTVGFNAAKRFKVKEVFGIMIAGILMYSTFMSPAEGVTGYSFGLFTIPAYNYKSSIFPVILSVYLFSLVFHFVDKRIPKNLRIVFSGSISFLIAAPLFLAFAAPLGNYISKGMTGAFAWLFTNAGPFAGALFCGIIPLTVIFGIKGWSAIELQNLSTLGYDYMLPNFFYSNLAVSGAIMAYALKNKGEQRSAAISTSLVCVIGITEPALYGIALPEKKPLYIAMAAGAIAGAVAMLLGVVTYAFSMPGITSIATYIDDGNNFLMLLIVMAVAWLSSFVLGMIFIKKED